MDLRVSAYQIFPRKIVQGLEEKAEMEIVGASPLSDQLTATKSTVY